MANTNDKIATRLADLHEDYKMCQKRITSKWADIAEKATRYAAEAANGGHMTSPGHLDGTIDCINEYIAELKGISAQIATLNWLTRE